jgi:hypothetical protein
MKWRIEHDSDTGPSDEGYWEWWDVTDGERSFRCTEEADAKWLYDLLNSHEKGE